MPQSTISSKNQTTVPKEVRERLRVGPADVLRWELLGSEVRVTAASRAFLERRGGIKVGPGDPVEDVRRARAMRGIVKA